MACSFQLAASAAVFERASEQRIQGQLAMGFRTVYRLPARESIDPQGPARRASLYNYGDLAALDGHGVRGEVVAGMQSPESDGTRFHCLSFRPFFSLLRGLYP